MPLINRDYGTPLAIQDGLIYSLEQDALYGQQVGIVVTQNIRLGVNQSGYDMLLNESLEPIATALRVSLGSEVDWIHFSFNSTQYIDPLNQTSWLVADLLGVIVVSVGQNMQISGRDILNALTGTMFEYWQSGPFTVQARALGSPAAGVVANPTLEAFKKWLVTIPGSEHAQEAKDAAANSTHYWYNQFPIDWQTFFQPQDKSAFSPLSSTPATMDNALLIALIAIYARSPEGRHSLERMAVKYLDSCARIVEAVEDSCHANWLTALNNQHIAAGIAHRIGLMDDGAYLKTIEHYRAVFDKMLVQGYVVEGLHTLVQGTKNLEKAGAFTSILPEGA